MHVLANAWDKQDREKAEKHAFYTQVFKITSVLSEDVELEAYLMEMAHFTLFHVNLTVQNRSSASSKGAGLSNFN